MFRQSTVIGRPL